MKYLTFISALPGAKGHKLLRSLYSDDTIIYANNIRPERAPLFEAYPNHVTYTLDDGTRVPRLLDRAAREIDKMELSTDEYHEWANAKLEEIHNIYQKQIIMVSHEPANIIRDTYPESTIYYIDLKDANVTEVLSRLDLFKTLHPNAPQSTDWLKVHEILNANKSFADHIVNYNSI
jgi:hypothetical protein